MEIGHAARLVIFYAAGLLVVSVVSLFPLTLLAGVVRTLLFDRQSKRKSMAMEPSKVLGLNKQKMDAFIFGIGYFILLGIYSLFFFHFF